HSLIFARGKVHRRKLHTGAGACPGQCLFRLPEPRWRGVGRYSQSWRQQAPKWTVYNVFRRRWTGLQYRLVNLRALPRDDVVRDAGRTEVVIQRWLAKIQRQGRLTQRCRELSPGGLPWPALDRDL